ncbi:MAG: hypothetical protein JWO59_2493, partial [Chloroflexi bacterium]|nr:hypothetical protein [Chloroflexota bacterium]
MNGTYDASSNSPKDIVTPTQSPPTQANGFATDGRPSTLLMELVGHALEGIRRLERTSLPVWATPLAIASLAMIVIQSMDHGYIRTQQALAVVVAGFLVVLFVSLYMALTRPGRRLVTLRQRHATALLIVLLAGNTVVHAVMALPLLAHNQRYTNDAVTVTDCAAQMVMHGGNPYKNVHMLTCLDSHGLGYASTTPKAAGAFWQLTSYPPPASAKWKWVLYHIYVRDLEHERR